MENEENEPKKGKQIIAMSLNREIVDELKTELNISNLSAWVEEKMRFELELAKHMAYLCPTEGCGNAYGFAAWNKRGFVCPACKQKVRYDQLKKVCFKGGEA